MIANPRLVALGLGALMTISFQTATSAQSTVGQGPLDLSNIVLAPNAETFSLNNGMEVVVIPDRRAPIVTHMVWYRVGSADEPPGKSGIAHYLEHLMFKGTEENPGSTFTGAVSRVGGRDNAFTSSDYTAYFQQVSKEHLPAMMAFEADRMNNLVLNEEVSAPELNVVLEERRSRVETRPASELGEAIDAALFVNHPYGDPIIGWPEEVAALTFQDALDFYEVHYRPENAVLVVAGDVTPEDIKTIAEQTYGKVPPGGGKIERTRPPIQKLRADRVVTLTDQRVRQPSTQVSWIVPSYTTAEPGVAEALDVLAEIMGGTNTSRLYTAMVREDPVAASAGAYYQSSAIDDTRFVLYASPRGDVALETLEERARAILADIAEKGVTDDEVRRAKTTVLSGVVFAQDSQSSMARIFGASLTTGATVEDVQNWPSRISAVTADDVQNVASTLLHGRASVTGRLLPQKGS